jgi:HTH-type transcriptional regulator/antitoxin HigA
MKLIKTPKDHAAALERLEELMLADPAAPGSPGDEELELLAFLVEDYEKRAVRIPAATPAEAIRFRMEQAELKQRDLVPFIGSKARVSEVLSGKRGLTLAMVRKLHEGLGIPLKWPSARAATASRGWNRARSGKSPSGNPPRRRRDGAPRRISRDRTHPPLRPHR